LKESAATPSEAAAVGLVQQALVDLGFNLGKTGPNKDGVDSLYGPPTTAAVKAFRTAEAVPGAASGEVDQPTLKCLDEQRAHVAVAPSLKPNVTPADVQVKDRQIGGRDEEVLFDRGSSTVDVGGKAKITRLLANPAVSLKGCPITLEGYVSEDELVEFGPSLAEDRINAVSGEFAAQGHDNPGPVCTKPARTLRTPSPLPVQSARSSDYRAWRKVEVARARGVDLRGLRAVPPADQRGVQGREGGRKAGRRVDGRRHRQTDAGQQGWRRCAEGLLRRQQQARRPQVEARDLA